MNSGTLYVVATPVGNLQDVTLRVIEILKSVDAIYSEDTRVTSKLLRHLEIPTDRLYSYHHHSPVSKKEEIAERLANEQSVAVVTDAGTPGISDPGNELVDFLLSVDGSSQVIPIPGPSALTTALSICGFNVNRHVFLGFLPRKKRGKLMELARESKLPIAFFESPYRVIKSLRDFADVLGSARRVFVGRELTKLHETHYRGPIRKVIAQLEEEKKLKGEIVVIIEGA